MDESSTRAVSSALTMFDIMEHNVSIVENLERGRQPFPDMDAVYFISPSVESINKVMGKNECDFSIVNIAFYYVIIQL